MADTRRTKLLRDLWSSRGRAGLVAASIAVGAGAIGTVLGAYSVIDREIATSFTSTQPPAAVISIAPGTIEPADAERIAAAVPGVSAAESRREVLVRMTNEPGWQPLRLVVVEDFSDVRVQRFFPESGSFAPGTGDILLERASVKEVELAVGDIFAANAPGQPARNLTVVGLTHDPGRTPAWMFGNVVGYVTPETVTELGIPGPLSGLVIATEPGASRDDNRATASAVASALTTAGATITGTDVPVPGEHPAAGVMRTLLYLLGVFGVVTLLASAALVTTLIVSLMNQQSKQIALMKAAGATSRQIASIYVGAVALLAVVGLAFGVPLGLLGARGLVTFAFTLLNLEAGSFAPAAWVWPAQAAVALLVPLVAIGIPLWQRSRVPVREGLSPGNDAPTKPARLARALSGRGRSTDLGFRNAFRHPGRTVLGVVALALGASAFAVAFNTGAAWDRMVNDEFAARDYAVSVRLSAPTKEAAIADALDAADGVSGYELWNVQPGRLSADGGAWGAAVPVFVPPSPTTVIDYPLVEGRWLDPADSRALVVNQALTDPATHAGDTVSLKIGGTVSDWTVVGVVRQATGGQDGVAYASELPPGTWPEGAVNAVLVQGPDELAALAGTEQALGDVGVTVSGALSATDGRESLDDHLYIIMGLLSLMALLVAVVGLLGQIEMTGTSVLERRREIAVARTFGATARQVIGMVITEALVVASLAWVAAMAVAVPASWIVERAVGEIFLKAPLDLTLSPLAAAVTLLATLAVAAVSAAVPALEAADTPIHESISYE